jgi:hypothetical protein
MINQIDQLKIHAGYLLHQCGYFFKLMPVKAASNLFQALFNLAALEFVKEHPLKVEVKVGLLNVGQKAVHVFVMLMI